MTRTALPHFRFARTALPHFRNAEATERSWRWAVAGRRGSAALAVLALAGCGGHAPVPPAKSTLIRTFADPDGDAKLNVAPGEPLRDRRRKRDPGAVLATFAQITDLHVRDEESPSRVPFLDRYGEPFQPTFRPQEALSTQVVAAAVRAVDRNRPQAVFITGDVTDNAQRNELAWATTLLDGGTVTPDSGSPGYRGVQQADDPDPFYYRPDVDPPRYPGLLARAQRPVVSPGLTAPWYGVPGNHDVLLQGELAPDARTDRIATGTRLVTSLDPRARLPREATTAQAVDALLGAARGGRSLRVPADPERRSATAREMVRALAHGHPTRTPDRADYTVALGPNAEAVVLDVASRSGGQAPVTDPAQTRWLTQELATDKRIVVVSHQTLPDALLQVLDTCPSVVAAIHGDSHRNRITPRGRYWIIGTSSLADYPMQSRMFRLREHALETWMVDQDGRGLAGTARALAFLDAQGGRPLGYAGTRADRNVRLGVP